MKHRWVLRRIDIIIKVVRGRGSVELKVGCEIDHRGVVPNERSGHRARSGQRVAQSSDSGRDLDGGGPDGGRQSDCSRSGGEDQGVELVLRERVVRRSGDRVIRSDRIQRVGSGHQVDLVLGHRGVRPSLEGGGVVEVDVVQSGVVKL